MMFAMFSYANESCYSENECRESSIGKCGIHNYVEKALRIIIGDMEW